MSNKYCNLQGTQKISESYNNINDGFDKVESDINEIKSNVNSVSQRVDTIITTPIDGQAAAQELVDARGGKSSLGARLNEVDSQLAENTQQINFNNSRQLKPLITFIDDDGHIDCLNALKPLLDAKGYKGCSAVITGFAKSGSADYMNFAQVKQLQDAGWEILSHTVSHKVLTTLTESEIEYELKKSKEELIANGLNVTGSVYPSGAYNASVLKINRKYYKYGFSGWGYNYPPLRSSKLVRVSIGYDNNLTLNDFKNHVNRAIANNYWLVFSLHFYSMTPETKQIFIDLLDYIASLDVDVVTANEGYQQFANIIEAWNEETDKYFAVGADGEPYGNAIYKSLQIKDSTGVTVNTPITAFDKNKITIMNFLHASASGFPKSDAGILKTYRADTDSFAYQEWIPLDLKTIYRRRWNTSTNNWYVWNIYNYVNIDDNDARLGTDKPSTYPQGLTITPITTAGSSTFTGVAGVLYTYRFNLYDNGKQYQEYHEVASNNVYFRTSGWGDVWGAWVLRSMKQTKDYTMTAKTVPANSCLDVIVPFSGLTDSHTIYAHPKSAIESNVGFSVFYYNDNNLKIRFINPTTESISLAEMIWKITIS